MSHACPEKEKKEKPLFVLQALPPALARHLLLLLPADARVRASCVCVAWYNLVHSPALALWREVDLSKDAGVRPISSWWTVFNSISHIALREYGVRQRDVGIVRLTTPFANADALKELVKTHKDTLSKILVHANAWLNNALEPRDVLSMLRTAPRLVVETPILCAPDEVGALREDKKLAKNLRVTGLVFKHLHLAAQASDAVQDMQLHPLRALVVAECAGEFAAPLIRAAVQPLHLTYLCLRGCHGEIMLEPLTFVLQNGSLRTLAIHSQCLFIQPPDGIAAFCSALATSLTLRSLLLVNVGLFQSVGGVSVLRGAALCVGLEELSITNNSVSIPDSPCCAAAVGAVLGGMVSGQLGVTSLKSLDVANCDLATIGLKPLVSALSGNTTLHTLNLGYISKEFHRDELLPAVRANQTLLHLRAGYTEAELFVARRRRARV